MDRVNKMEDCKGKSLAIAYAMKKKHKMAKGGMIEEEEMESGYEPMPKEHAVHNIAAENEDEDMVGRILKNMAKGGEVDHEVDAYDHGKADMIADSDSADYDYLDEHGAPEFHEDAANSGDEDGDGQEDEDRHDMVKRALKSKMMKKNHNPRPA